MRQPWTGVPTVPGKKGFTLVEVLIAIFILIVLTGYSLLNVPGMVQAWRVRTLQKNLEVMRTAIYNYYKDHDSYPWGITELTTATPYPYISKIPKDITGDYTWEVLKANVDISTQAWGFYPLNENVGLQAFDQSGSGNTSLNLNNGAAWNPGGVLNTCVFFDGANDELDIGADAFFDGVVTQKTAILWYNAVAVAGAAPQILFEEGGGTNGMNLYIRAGQVWAGAWTNPWGRWNSAPTTAGAWHQVAFTFDSGAGFFTIYHDGVPIMTQAPGGQINNHGGDNTIGRGGTRFDNGGGPVGFGAGTSNPYNGLIDEIRFYDTALGDQDILDLYNMVINPGDTWLDWGTESSTETIKDVRSGNGAY